MGPAEPGHAAAARPPAGPGHALTVEAAAARILAYGRARVAASHDHANVASAVGVAQYVAIAAEVAARLGETGGRMCAPPGVAGLGPRRPGRANPKVLDWGAGWGQTSLLLRAHGLDVVAYDVADKGAGAELLAGSGVAYVVAVGPGLPFPAGAFDGVLNCGVLEHVDDERAALGELARVLRPGGWLFTYHLPNRHAWTEWLGRRLGRFHHERTYTEREARGLFEAAGFHVVACRPFHLLPRNVWGRRAGLTRLTARGARLFEAADAGLLRLPGFARVATAWALLARRS